MHRPSAIRVIAAAGPLSVLLPVLVPATAYAGQFTVASCQADRVNFSTTAFNDFATRGMTIRRACNPVGPGIRGLVTANSPRRGVVPRGAVAMVALSAPSGTRFTTFRWAGSARRVDCRYALQLYAEGPDIKPVAIKNVRANQHCPRRAGGQAVQAAGYRLRTFNVSGATRIVQRVICQGGGGRKSCSARGANYIRTYQAEVNVVDDASTDRDDRSRHAAHNRRLGKRQPAAQLRRAGQRRRPRRAGAHRRRSRAGPTSVRARSRHGRRVRDRRAVPERAGAHHGEDTRPLRGHAASSSFRRRTPPATSARRQPITVRIDNTPPARVGLAVDGGDAWRNQNDFALTWANPPEDDRAPIVAANYKLCPASGGGCSEGEQTGDGIAQLADPGSRAGRMDGFVVAA